MTSLTLVPTNAIVDPSTKLSASVAFFAFSGRTIPIFSATLATVSPSAPLFAFSSSADMPNAS